MEQYEIDKLVSEIQDYLNQDEMNQNLDDIMGPEEMHQEDEESGSFMEAKARTRMERSLKYFQFALYAIEVLTISLFTAAIFSPFSTWPQTAMFLIGVLLFGIFAMTIMLGLQARIRLLFKIESNTRQIALSKMRIAEVLGKIGIE